MTKEVRRCYLHLYFNREKAADNQGRMNRYLSALKSELEQNKVIPEHQRDYAKYFDVTDTPKRAWKIVAKEAVIQQATRDYGYFSLLINEVEDSLPELGPGGESVRESEGNAEREKSFGLLGNRAQREALCGIYCLNLSFLHQETDAGG